MANGTIPSNLRFEQGGKCFEVQLFLLDRNQQKMTTAPLTSLSAEVMAQVKKIFSSVPDPATHTLRYMSPDPESCVWTSRGVTTDADEPILESARTIFGCLNKASPKAPPAAQPTVEELDQTTQGDRKGLSYFADLKHAELVAYARKPDLTNERLTEAYQIYKDVVEFPDKDSTDDKRKAMLEWIRIYYLELLKWYQNHDLSKLASRESIDPDKKANYYAAMGVLAFVKIDGVSVEKLIEKLINQHS